MATPKKIDAGAGAPVDATGYAPYGSFVAGASFVRSPFWDDLDGLVAEDVPGGYLGYSGEMHGRNEWDRVRINGILLPGIWSATATPTLQLDVQKPNGYDGAALIQKGYAAAQVTLTGKLWHPMHWAEFQKQLPMFWRAPNKFATTDVKSKRQEPVPKQLSVSIYAPGIAPLGLSNMVIYQITPPEETDQPQVRQIKMLARQYVPEPQKRSSAVRKVEGTPNSEGRSVQAAIIKANANPPALGSYAGALRKPTVANQPLSPSITQADYKLPTLRSFEKR